MSAAASSPKTALVNRLPPHGFFMVSALFHYLGPSFAVLLFAEMGVLGVAWLRIASAAAIFALWCRPWRVLRASNGRTRGLIVALGVTLALMNSVFYLAIDRMPLATVAAIEFVATIAIALIGLRSRRNLAALAVAVGGVFLLIGFEWSGDWLGLGFALANAVLFAGYIVLGHRISRSGGTGGVARLGTAMLVALVVALPLGIGDVAPVLSSPLLIFAGIGVGVSSSVIPYICDQLAMARLPRATFALMLTLLPATAAVVGAVVLRQVPSAIDIAGIVLVALGVGLHKAPAEQEREIDAPFAVPETLHMSDDLGFTFRATKGGEVFVHHRGKLATTLRGDAAADFLAEVDGADHGEQQQIMARATGNYRRGNERLAKNHPRNR